MDCRSAIALLAIAFLLGTSASAQRDATEPTAVPVGTATGGDGDPRIDADEIAAPAIDSTHPSWPRTLWHEDPATIRCDGRRACEDAKANATAERAA